MKKLLLFSLVFLGALNFMSSAVYADCKVMSCGDTDFFNAKVPADVGGNQCWFCGPGKNSCNNNDVVPYIDAVKDVVWLYKCKIDLKGTSWQDYTPGFFCKDSQLQSAKGLGSINTNNAKVTYRLEGSATSSTSLGDWDAFSGEASCIYVKCNDGYMPNAEKTACVLDDRESRCTNTGGTWSNGACSCSNSKNITQSSDGMTCVCINNNYEPNGANGCKKTQAALQQEQQQQQQQLAQQRKKTCEDSGGSWTGSKCQCSDDKNMINDGNYKCKCKSVDYTYDSSVKTCKITDVAAAREACNTTDAKNSGAYWDDQEQKCKCQNNQHIWDGKVCKFNPAITECYNIVGAVWENGECGCSDPNKTFTGNACVDLNNTGGTSGVSTSAQTVSRERILAAKAKIDEIKSGLKLTAWRDAEGNFNTSRLLSDSIAGVVLGTAGGLITSNVVKKSQVEDGFEDIQCSVGGQVVAGWGDEFRVGIQ